MSLQRNTVLAIALLSMLCFAGVAVRADEWIFTERYIEEEALFVGTGTWTNHTGYATYNLSVDTFVNTLGWNYTTYELIIFANVTLGTNVSFYLLDEPNHTNFSLGEPSEKLIDVANLTLFLDNFTIPVTPTNATYFFVFDNRASTLDSTIDFVVDIWEWYVTPAPPPPIPFISLPAALIVAVAVLLGVAYTRRRRHREGA